MSDLIDSAAVRLAQAKLTRRAVLAGGLAAFLHPWAIGKADAAVAGCPSCGSCTTVTVNPSTGKYKLSSCADHCLGASLCAKISTDKRVKALRTALANRGIVQASNKSAHAVIAKKGTKTLGQGVALKFQDTATPGQSAWLVYAKPANGHSVVFAFVYRAQAPAYILGVDAAGTVTSHVPPKLTKPTAALDSADAVAQRASLSQDECGLLSDVLCGLGLGIVSFVLTGLICAGSGPAAGACAAVVGWEMFGTLTGVLCHLFSQRVCRADFVRCSCDGVCYPSDQEQRCLSNCKASLGCFTGICEPHEAIGCNAISL
jgi:hypothetical protein